MIHILDAQNDNLVGVLDNKGDRIYWNDNHTQGVDGYNVLQFTTFADIMESELLGKRSRILIDSENGYKQEFIVFESTAHTSREMDVVAVGSETDIDKQIIIDPQRINGKTTEQIVEMATRTTEWQAGNIEYGGVRSFDVDDYIGGYELLQMAAKEFDMELVYRVESDGNYILGRFVDMVKRVGEDNAKEITYGKDLIGITRKIYSERIVTAILVVGPEPEEVDGVKPERMSTMVVDDDAFQRWNRNGNHIIGIHEPETDDQAMTLARLKTLGKMELDKRIDAVTEYEIVAVSIEREHDFEKVRLGDSVRVIDTEFKPALYAKARVISVSRTLDDTLPKEYIIGSVIEYDEDEVRKTLVKIQKEYGLAVIRAPQPPAGKNNVLWIDTSGKIDVAHSWQGDEWVKFTPTEPGDIGAVTPDESKMDAEVENLRTIKRIITTNQSGLNLEYDMLIDNAYIVDTISREILDASKTKSDNLVIIANAEIDNVIQDDYISVAERKSVIAKIEAAQSAQGEFGADLAKSFEDVAAAQALEAKQQAKIAEEAAKDALVKAEAALTDIVNKVDKSAYDKAIKDITDGLSDKASNAIVNGKVDKSVYDDAVNSIIADMGDKAGIDYVDNKILSSKQFPSQNTAPVRPKLNDLWFDTVNNVLKKWDGSKWAQAKVNINELDVYTTTQVDNALNGKVATTTYNSDKAGLIADITSNSTAVSQNSKDIALKANQNSVDSIARTTTSNTAAIGVNAREIELKAAQELVDILSNTVDTSAAAIKVNAGKIALSATQSSVNAIKGTAEKNEAAININAGNIALKAAQTYVDAIGRQVDTNKAAINVNAGQIRLKASQESITALTKDVEETIADIQATEIRLSEAEQLLSDDSIISTVTSSTQFEALFNDKANASDLAGYASSEALKNMIAELEALGDDFAGIRFGEFVTSTELEQRDLSLVAKISASSGVNLIRNSVGLAQMEGWDVSGKGSISATGNPELDGLGYHSGFMLNAMGVLTMSQDVAVIAGKSYTLSYSLRNTNRNGSVIVRVLDAVSGRVIATADTYDETGAGMYGDVHMTFKATSGQIRIQISAPPNKSAIITALMLNIGEVAFSWTTSVGELYNTTIKMDLNGLRVSQYDDKLIETGFTVMTPKKFAGYYNASGMIDESIGSEDEVFRMDKEEFVMKKANVKEEITMGSIKLIEVNEPTRKGWAFVPNF